MGESGDHLPHMLFNSGNVGVDSLAEVLLEALVPTSQGRQSRRGVAGNRRRGRGHGRVRDGVEIEGLVDNARHGRRRNTQSNPIPCNFDLNEALPLLDLNQPPLAEHDRYDNSTPQVGNGLRETQVRPQTESEVPLGRRQGGYTGVLQRGRGSGSNHESSSEEHVNSRGPGRSRPRVRWSPPVIHPTLRSLHSLRRPRRQGPCSQTSPTADGATEATAENYSPNSALGHHLRRARLTLESDTIHGGGTTTGVQWGLLDAFEASTRVEEWLHHHDNLQEEVGTIADVGLGRSVSKQGLPSVVWVTLSVLGLNPTEWGGITEVVGEPQQQWQEKGVPFYFVIFKGSIGGRKVKVADCRYLMNCPVEVLVERGVGPSQRPGGGFEDNSIPEFATQRLDEEALAAMRDSSHRMPATVSSHEQPGRESEQADTLPRGFIASSSDHSSDSEWRAIFEDFAGENSSIDYSEHRFR